MENNEIPINYNYDNQEVNIEMNEVIYDRNIIESISVNGVAQQVDENKNVDITVPTKLSDLSNDNNTVQDASYVHTDNNYTNAEKNKLAELENYDDTEIQNDISNLNADITDLSTNKADRTEIPTTLAELTDDSTHRTVTDVEKTNWSNKSDFSGNYNDLTNKPSIPTKTSDLTNDNGFIDNSVNNLTNYTLAVDTGSSIDLSMNSTTYELTLSLKNSAGNVLNSKSVDLPIETMVVNGRYDNINKKIVLVLDNGNTIDVPVGDLVAGLQSEITSNNKLASDLVDDTNQVNKFVSASEKQTWNNKSDFSGDYEDLSNKPTIPEDLSDLNDDATHRLVTDIEKTTWNNKSNFSGSYNDLTDKPTIPVVPTNVSAFTNDAGYLTQHQDISGKEDKNNKVTSISSSSTDTQYPSAKCVYDIVGDVETILETLISGGGVS